MGEGRPLSALELERERLEELLAQGEVMLAAARATIADIDAQLGRARMDEASPAP